MAEDLRLEPDDARANEPETSSRWQSLWERLSKAGLADITLRLGTHTLLLALILLVAYGMHEYYRFTQAPTSGSIPVLAAQASTPAPVEATPALPEFQSFMVSLSRPADQLRGVSRQVDMHTDIPSRPRQEVTKYTVQAGDTLFGIAEKFGLKPETILWGNQFVLGDNPHNIRPDQELNILPVDGTYHRWSAGDGLNGVAKILGVTPDDIISYPANNLDPLTIGDWSNPNIEPGTWLVVPGGERAFVSWSAPAIPRDNPSVARVLGAGACESVADGLVGSGSFVWPANHHYISGFDFNPSANHSGIDIDGETGDPVYAADSGVVVYAGWNDWGYGNVVVINHGNGWQTLYAHLHTHVVGCGQGVAQGSAIGTIGASGNATGSHLHFEMMYEGAKVNPWNFLP
jgi:murein DD-endopeptidase MepM/ murein hydrolase activator NlpD